MEVRKFFFFEKKKQKTFIRLDPTSGPRRAPMRKSFLLLFFKKEALAFFLACCPVLAQAQMPPQNPDWPCAQRLVNTLESGSYWNGMVPTHTAWRDNEALFNLVTTIVDRDTPDAVSVAKLTAYADKIPKSARATQYPLIFSAIIDQTNDDRDILIQRIEQLGHRQNELGATIAGLSTKLDSMPDSAPTRSDTLGTRDFDIRVFKETQQTMRYACEAPANMERRLGLFASTLQKEMK